MFLPTDRRGLWLARPRANDFVAEGASDGDPRRERSDAIAQAPGPRAERIAPVVLMSGRFVQDPPEPQPPPLVMHPVHRRLPRCSTRGTAPA